MVTYKVLENHPQDSRIKIKDDGIFQTMGVRGGQEYEPHTLLVLEIRTDEMQETTGCLSPGAHAGSYNGQDAYNDMLVVDNGTNSDGIRPSKCWNYVGGVSNIEC